MRTLFMVMGLAPSLALAQTDLKSYLDAAQQSNVDRRISIESRNRAASDFTAAWGALLPSATVQGGWTHNQFPAELSVPRTDANGDVILQTDDNGNYLINPVFQRQPDGSVLPNPQVGSLVPETTTRAIVLQNQFDLRLRVDLPLIDVSRWLRVAGAGLNKDSAELRDAYMRDVIARQVVAAYYGYAASLHMLESAQRSAAVAGEQLKLMEIRTRAGATTELDLARANAEMQRTRQTVADASVLVATSRRTLRSLTGLTPPDTLPDWEDNLAPEAGLEDLEGRIDNLPAVQASDKEADAAGLASAGAGLMLVPTVGASFTENISNATGFTGQNASYALGVVATWRLDVPTIANISSVGAQANQAKLAAEKTRLQARDQINADWHRFNAALTKIDAAKAQVEAAQRAAQVAKDRYAVGSATQVDVIQAERDLFMSEVSHISARTELATARASLRLSAALSLD